MFLWSFFCFINNGFSQKEKLKTFKITDSIRITTLYILPESDALIVWAAKQLAEDIELITGLRPQVVKTNTFDNPGIYIGEHAQHSKLGTADFSNLTKRWEAFNISLKENKLFIVGSDVRGTVYGVFELAKQLGVSPWVWWGDVVPKKQTELSVAIPENGIFQEPSVKYRGVFLNDEDWGLQPWAAKTFEPETGDIGPKTYEKIFQLLLRLKANTIWPAMHPCTQGFYTVKGNQDMAKKYQIVIGTSHAEPMLRNNVDEWDKKLYGEYNYFTNSETVNNYWASRINQVGDSINQNIITLGMRGVHDSHMEGAKSVADSKQMLQNIINNQRAMIDSLMQKPILEIPQVFISYKEVLELYDKGLYLPEDVTLMWTDDNYGYIRRLSNSKEQQRQGGSGVYYHLSYWGRPHDYLWLSTTQPGLIWYEMNKAYENGARSMWIANVGDIKPAEYNTQLFLDLAWNINSVDVDSIYEHLLTWFQLNLGEEVAEESAKVISEYYRLAFIRKPEYMGWSQTEPTTQVKFSTLTKEEIQERVSDYKRLSDRVEELSLKVPEQQQSAWFQFIEYPVMAAANMNFKFLYWQLASQEKSQTKKESYEKWSKEAYAEIKELTDYYNNTLQEGKWNGIMSMNPRGLPVFEALQYEFNPEDIKYLKSSEKVLIKGSEFSKSEGVSEYAWKPINGLGFSNASVTLFPFHFAEFDENKPGLEYKYTLSESGHYVVKVHFLPTHTNVFNQEADISLDDNKYPNQSISTEGRSAQWKENVLRNSAVIALPKQYLEKGKHHINIEVNQTGMVIDYVEILKELY
ncbi:glycosyl hydrolase 115 family protein [Formosa sp. S-31]